MLVMPAPTHSPPTHVSGACACYCEPSHCTSNLAMNALSSTTPPEGAACPLRHLAAFRVLVWGATLAMQQAARGPATLPAQHIAAPLYWGPWLT